VTASAADSSTDQTKLPLWRLIAGFAVIATLIVLLVMAGLVYVDNYRLDAYMRIVAAQPASAALPDAAVANMILHRASDLDLPLHRSDITVIHKDGRVHIKIARYGVQTYLGRMDLRMPEAESR
jgi:hypothetical protein